MPGGLLLTPLNGVTSELAQPLAPPGTLLPIHRASLRRKLGYLCMWCICAGLCDLMGCVMYSVSLSLASPAFPLAMSSAPVLLGQGNPHPTRVRMGFLSCLIEQPPLGVPVPPKPTGALEIFFVHCFLPLSGAAFRLFILKNIKPLAPPASPPPTIAAGWC